MVETRLARLVLLPDSPSYVWLSLAPIFLLLRRASLANMSDAESFPRKPMRSSLRVIVLAAFLLRLAVIIAGHTYRITPRRDHFQFGWEMGRLARSIAMGNGFSSPTDLPTGPSAWAPPVYPYILAGVFKMFGIYTAASAFAILALNSIFAAFTCVPLYGIAECIYGAGVARATAWTWAIFPYMIYWPVRVVWETSLTTFLLCVALMVTLQLREQPLDRDMWLGLGAIWGVLALTNTAVLSMLPFCLLWIWFYARRKSFYGITICALVCCAISSTWMVRNYIVFGRFVPVRDNLSLELHMANNVESSGFWTRSEHPGNDPEAMREFQQLGEIRYMEQKNTEFRRFVRDHFGKFCWFTLKRAYFFWSAPPSLTVLPNGWNLEIARHTGFLLGGIASFAGLWLSIRNHKPAAFLLAAFLLIYPLPYYLVTPFPRYKAPIEPEMTLLIVYMFWQSRRVQLHFCSLHFFRLHFLPRWFRIG